MDEVRRGKSFSLVDLVEDSHGLLLGHTVTHECQEVAQFDDMLFVCVWHVNQKLMSRHGPSGFCSPEDKASDAYF